MHRDRYIPQEIYRIIYYNPLKMQQFQPQTIFKFIVVGNSMVGKTNILSRYTQNSYNPSIRNTVGIEFSSRKLQIHDKQIQIQIWDTAGKEKYKCMSSMFYRGAQGAVVVFALNDRTSFQELQRWIQEIKDNAVSNVDIIVVGNKSDLEERVVESEEGMELARSIGCEYLEVSACQNRNIDSIFESLLISVYKRYQKQGVDIKKSMIKPVRIKHKRSRAKDGGCC